MPAISQQLRLSSLSALGTGLAAGALLLAASACASTGSASPSGTPGGRVAEPPPSAAWPVKTREHVDLWLHGYAMLQDDAGVPVTSVRQTHPGQAVKATLADGEVALTVRESRFLEPPT